MRSNTTLFRSSALALTLCAADLLGCGGGTLPSVQGSPQTANRSQGLQIGPIASINGSYQDNTCLDPASGNLRVGASWSAPLSAGPGTDPTVVLNNTGCVLDITSITVADSIG